VHGGGLREDLASSLLHAGHRERLRERFRLGGAEAMPDYEVLELILFRAIPRRDIKPIAKELIRRFGLFAEAISAPRAEVPGLGDAATTELQIVRAAALRLMQGEGRQRPVLSSRGAVVAYCRAAMAFEAREQFRMLFLDKL
jgi:DNA repair protein RadC